MYLYIRILASYTVQIISESFARDMAGCDLETPGESFNHVRMRVCSARAEDFTATGTGSMHVIEPSAKVIISLEKEVDLGDEPQYTRC